MDTGRWLVVVPLFLSLGLDTFAVAVGLGISGLDRRRQLRFGLSFALAEGLMPLVGFLLGWAVARALGNITSYLAVILLLGVGLYTVWEAKRDEDRAYEESSFLPLLLIALSVSLDELAVGFGLGLLHVPLLMAIVYIALQAFVLTLLGTSLGGALGDAFAERAEMLSGVVLTLLAFVLLGEKLLAG